MNLRSVSMFGILAALSAALFIAGCGKGGAEAENGRDEESVAETSHADGGHGEWWCPEHGVPEEECSMCSAKVADDFKAQGDWCEKHNRAASQCFICDPARAEKFVALYEAKYGEKPPKPTE